MGAAVVMTIGRQDEDIRVLCARLRGLLAATDAAAIVCDVAAITAPDCSTVDAVASLQLTARRLKRRIWLRHASPELHELLVLAGLADVVPSLEELPLEAERQTEEREHPRGIEEERDAADPTA